MKKKLVVLSFVLSVLGVSALAGAENASAQSAFDNLVQNHDGPYNIAYNQTYHRTFQNSFEIGQFLGSFTSGDQIQSQAQNFCGAVTPNIMYHAIQRMAEGKPYVIVYTDPSVQGQNNAGRTITVYVQMNDLATITWDWASNQNGAWLYMHSSQPSMLALHISSGFSVGDIRLCGGNQDEYVNVAAKDIWTQNSSLFLVETNYPVTNYPEGYQGEPLNVIQPAKESSDWTPDWYVSVGKDWKAAIHDQNFNTFDGNPFLCDGEFAPILNYEIWDRSSGNETLLYDGYNSSTVQIDYQFEKLNEDKQYRIVGWYSGCNDREFTESSFHDFTINKKGDLHRVGLGTCVGEEFPWINMESCLVGLNDTLALLAFNFNNPTNDAVKNVSNANPNSCYTMQTLDSWMHLNNQELCPAFSATVRNIVTPFITFVLGGVVFYYISRNKGMVIS